MYKAMKILAIGVLIVTIAGAGVVLYGIRTLAPVVAQVQVTVTPAQEAQDIFDGVLAQVSDGTFTGRVFSASAAPEAEDCAFVTYTVRLANRGFFPAEWVSLDMHPIEGDLLQLDNVQANVLAGGSQGDIAVTILHAGDGAQTQRGYTIQCYVFGRKITLQGSTQ